MALGQNLMALIAAFLFALTLAFMDTAHAAVTGTNLPSSANSPTGNTAPPTHDPFLNTRDPVSVSCVVNNYETAYLSDNYDEVASHIRNIPGNATLGNKPGGGWCLRYSCTEELAIYGCNDNEADMQVPWATMAEYADAIKEECTTLKRTHGHYKPVVLGQAFDAGGWNVILGIEPGTLC
ncbi:hypothetical protein DHEL01_v208165 [Diaporthe helianthi]|uniref:Ecp2 effector protein domain-containing protein n=1 Tax=Diaporthe helianthi TaxID=158607 RepID=A0A2P5HTA4_DIAHE|nr:hypothetical protein DHEL01_v208165 [Diaporthe helianthi]